MVGAGGGSRTLVLSLGRIHNSRYTTPAGSARGAAMRRRDRYILA